MNTHPLTSWTSTTLEECTDILDSKRIPVNSTEREKRKGNIPYYGATGQVGFIDNYIFDEELVLLGEDGAPFFDTSKQIAYIIKGKSWVNNHAHVLRALNVTSNAFLCHYLNTFNFEGYVTGTTRYKLNQSRMKKIPVPLPPLPEQHRIVSKIEELFSRLDAGVNALEQIKAQLKPYCQSVLKAAVEGRLTADWREAHKHELESASELLKRILKQRRTQWETAQLTAMKAKGKTPKNDKWKHKYQISKFDNPITNIPSGWEWTNIRQLTQFVTSGSRGWAKYYSDEGPIFIRSQNINQDFLNLNDIAHVSIPKKAEGARTRVQLCDLLVIITGANVTKAARVDFQIGEAYVSQHVSLIRPVMQEISPYLHLWLISNGGGRDTLNKLAYGAGKPGLNLDNIRDLPVALPPMQEQAAICSEVTSKFQVIQTIEDLLSKNLKSTVHLRQSILKKAFEGRLVEQNPNDEPADKLLERIKAEKKDVEAALKSQKKKPIKTGAKKMNRNQKRLSLYDVLSERKEPISPEELFNACGFNDHNVDDFYRELKEEVDVKKRVVEHIQADSNNRTLGLLE